jgi:hypothetical protein
MNFPSGFPDNAQSAVVAAQIRASGRMENELSYRMPAPGYTKSQQLGSLGRSYILQIFAVFAYEACKLARDGIWTARRVDLEALEFLRQLAIELRSEYSHLGMPDMVGSMGYLDSTIFRELKLSNEWKTYQDTLLEVAEFQAQFPSANPSGDSKDPLQKALLTRSTESLDIASTISQKLDEIILREDISHEELASRIRVGRTTYFEVKAGRGGRKAKKKIDIYVSHWYQQHPT